MATNSHVCVFQRLAFSSIVAGFKARPILSFALASNRGTRATEYSSATPG